MLQAASPPSRCPRVHDNNRPGTGRDATDRVVPKKVTGSPAPLTARAIGAVV
jgi:hypothetical protein